ncbi:unnamed protein product [Discosporangium mesarthrocarpum]
MLRVDRVLSTAMFYPSDYGFIPQTLCGDGDPLDVLVMGTEKLLPGCIADVRPLGHLSMIDEKGEDEKVLAVPARDPRFKDVQTLDDVCEHHRREITHFFEKYKDLEGGKWVKIGNWSGTEAVYDLINSTHRSYMHSMARSPLDG